MKITRKAIKSRFSKIIEIPYCDMQSLLKYRSRDYHTEGVFGWNADVFVIDYNTAICTGYRPFGNIHPDFALIREYDQKAKDIPHGWLKGAYEERKEQVEALLAEFLKKVLQGA